MPKQVILDRAGMAKRLMVSPRKLGELVKQGRVPGPERLGHRTHRWVIDPDAPLIVPAPSK